MKYTYTKTTKNILDFFSGKISYTYSKLDGIIYKDEANNVYFQNVDMALPIEKGQYSDSRFYTITKESQYRPDKLAYIAYGNENLAWILLKFNDITDPFELSAGTIIEIPSLSRVNTTLQNKRKELQYK
jgi:hypothetical protein